MHRLQAVVAAMRLPAKPQKIAPTSNTRAYLASTGLSTFQYASISAHLGERGYPSGRCRFGCFLCQCSRGTGSRGCTTCRSAGLEFWAILTVCVPRRMQSIRPILPFFVARGGCRHHLTTRTASVVRLVTGISREPRCAWGTPSLGLPNP